MAINALDGATPVTPSDSTPLSFTALYVGGAGNVAIRTRRGATVTFAAVPAGQYIWIGGDRVMSTNTTATLILALN